MSDFQSALVAEATKRSGVLWLALPDLPRPRAAWHIWYEGAAYVLTGGEGEQPLPGLPESTHVTVIVGSKDKGARLVSWTAEVTEIEPATDEWDAVVPVLARERLNGDQEQAERWARDSYVIRLSPAGEATTDHPAGYTAVRPVPTPATSPARRPFMVGARRRKADR